jgi:hypothetical protein
MAEKKNGSTKGKQAPALSATDAKAQAEMKMSAWVEMMDSTERMSVGTFYNIPTEFMEWHFVRCGIRNQPRAEALAATLREMGYQPAPKGVMMSGFESDNEGGLYLCIPVQIYKALQARKKEIKRRTARSVDDMIQGHASQIRNMMGSGSSMEVQGSTKFRDG